MNEEAINEKLPEMTERRTEMTDGRYLIYYEFAGGKIDIRAHDDATEGTEALKTDV